MKDFAQKILRETGYLAESGAPAEGLLLPSAGIGSPGDAARLGPLFSGRRGGLGADAVFRVGTSPVILFKSAEADQDDEAEWHRIAWNFGVAPLLWVTTPEYVRLYNAYQPPEDYGKRAPLLAEFRIGEVLGQAIDAACGRRRIAMGSFWKSKLARTIDRRTRIDNVLLSELSNLLAALVSRGLKPSLAQKLVGRCVFFQYLVHRGYLQEAELQEWFGAPTLHDILADLDRTYALFLWIRTTFNGDLFPIENEASERAQLGQTAEHLAPLADFFGHFNIVDGQGRLFPFRFDAIPVELISSIYEKFVHMSETDGAPRSGVHYTPINLVDLVLDPVFEGLQSDARVLDPACGSGVFLVESLRRLVWLRGRQQPISRELIRKTLLHQIRGVDSSPAALSVAAFSLYLALLELDPEPPSGIDDLACLKFDPLQHRVLFATSTFEPGLEERLLPADGADQRFDVIVGNPPWTYNAEEKLTDRHLAHAAVDDEENANETDLEDDIDLSAAAEAGSSRSGTTYARLNGLPIPPRSTDWAFLWRCRDFAGPKARIALVMKATPFFSLAPATHAARDAILRSFDNVTLVNLSQLRTSRLFQEYEGGSEDAKQKKRAAGPALLFLSNCLQVNAYSVAVLNFPWSSAFNRTGVFELPADSPKVLDLDRVKAQPGLLKAATFGTDRDAWFLERLSRNPRVCTFDDWCKASVLPAGRGYRAGTGMDAAHLVGLPRVNAKDMRRGRISETLLTFDDKEVNRSREPSLFKGPLVLLPEGSLTAAPLYGRYTAAFDSRDLAYNSSFVGVSFHGQTSVRAQALAAMMHSRFVAHQLAFTGGTLGVKQTKVEVVDLEAVRLPKMVSLTEADLATLAWSFQTLTGDNEDAKTHAAEVIDAVVEMAAGLSQDDRRLLADADRRTGAIFFETEAARRAMEAEPTELELRRYAQNLCSAFNAFASHPQDQVLLSDGFDKLNHDVIVARFSLTSRERTPVTSEFRPGHLDETDGALVEALGGTDLPYLKPAKSLRLYVGSHAYILKPAQYRCFSPAAGQTDADRIIADLMDPAFPVAELGTA